MMQGGLAARWWAVAPCSCLESLWDRFHSLSFWKEVRFMSLSSRKVYSSFVLGLRGLGIPLTPRYCQCSKGREGAALLATVKSRKKGLQKQDVQAH